MKEREDKDKLTESVLVSQAHQVQTVFPKRFYAGKLLRTFKRGDK